MKIGFTGVPSFNTINKIKCEFPSAEWIDLDVPPIKPSLIEKSEFLLPKTSCNIIKSIVTNTIALKPDIIVSTIGASKCDSMLFVSSIIKNELPNCKIIETENNDTERKGNPISISNLNLIEKIESITLNVIDKKQIKNLEKTKPKYGFWGVPPYDFNLLKIFPEKTHVYGWTRCMENLTPNDIELEMYVDKDIPIVFYTQSFCAKSILAKSLAKKYDGLYVELDSNMDSSTKEKIIAFLELAK